ncbi:MAG TPA: hypothetical protein VGK90_00080 [Rhizomicrobium sp.]|jgi:hypothetical protein
MNSITKTLLLGAAFGALATAPAVAGDVPNIHVLALHPGHQTVHKTSMHKGGVTNITSTIGVSTFVPASDLDKKVKLADTFYLFYDSGSFCNSLGKQKFKLQERKTQYAKLGYATLTYSGYCSSTGPTVLHGNTYKLTNPQGEGKTDSFVSSMITRFVRNGVKYKWTVNLDVNVAIGE